MRYTSASRSSSMVYDSPRGVLPSWMREHWYQIAYGVTPSFSDWQRVLGKPLNPHTTDWYNPFGEHANGNLTEEEQLDQLVDDLAGEYRFTEPLSPEEEALCDAWDEQQWREEEEERARRPRTFPLRVIAVYGENLSGLPLFCSVHGPGAYRQP